MPCPPPPRSGLVNSRQVLTGWGRTAPSVAKVVAAGSDDELAELVRAAGSRGVLARGLGRSYGDAALNAGGVVLDLTSRNGFVSEVTPEDSQTAVVSCDAGMSLDTLLRTIVAQGWFLPVTPSTRSVTIGGAIGSDVHGRNHRQTGSFGDHVRSLDLLTGTGDTRTLTPADELFWATVGGMGLTGVVLRATLELVRIETSSCLVDTRRCPDFDTLVDELSAPTDHPFALAWVDVRARGEHLGRSVVTRSRFARLDELPPKKQDHPLAFNPRTPLSAPKGLPFGLVNKFSVAAFNEAWFRRAPNSRDDELQALSTVFYPLDALADWNRVYGPGGLIQYQVAVPEESVDVIRDLIDAVSGAGAASFYGMLQRFGAANPGQLSFPTPGWTFALDLPATLPGLAGLLDGLDERVVACGGRGFLAKDSRMSPELVEAMYPALPRWRELRASADPAGVFQSDLARRLSL